MLALHAIWTAEDRLALWAEDGSRSRVAPRTRSRRTTRPHPFAADCAALSSVLGALGGDGDPTSTTLDLALPSGPSAPVPSPHLWTDDAPTQAGALRAWTVPVLTLAPDAAVDLLLAATPEPPAGTVLADSVRWLAQVARFALELCARGRVLPTLRQEADGWVARWRASVDLPEDAARRATLVRGAPAAIRTVHPDPVGRILDAAVHALATRALPRPQAGRRTADEAWLAALAGAPLGAAPGLAELAARLEAWSKLDTAPTDGFRTCFRIVAPDDDGAWRIEFLLQSLADPSLLVSAADVWRTRGRILRTTGGRDLADPQEKLLGDLGRATRLAPILRSSLAGARPSGLEVDAEGAWGFLREQAPLLAQSGFGVLAPPWWGQLLHAQRMEAVGRLAGGIAHDFNNLLTVILSFTSLMMGDLPEEDPRREDLEQVSQAATRAAALTAQLLAFSRQQVMQPRVIEIDEIVTAMEKLLRRLLGEDIELANVLGSSGHPVWADPGQIEQVIANLAVNARDAMPRGGKLTLETGLVHLDADYAAAHVGARVGSHVMLAVTDTGTGMTKEVQARIFEPFYTTKEVGSGAAPGPPRVRAGGRARDLACGRVDARHRRRAGGPDHEPPRGGSGTRAGHCPGRARWMSDPSRAELVAGQLRSTASSTCWGASVSGRR